MRPSAVSVLGCGWLGRPLAVSLVEDGIDVTGSTTTPDKIELLREDGITPVRATLDPDLSSSNSTPLFQSPVLVLNIPPPKNVDDVTGVHRRQVEAVRDASVQGAVEWVLFASSTSVYPTVERTVTEADQPPGRPDALPGSRRRSGDALLAVERVLMETKELDVTVVRLSGLYGGDRHPARYLAGRSDVGRPNAPVNLLHRDDAVGVFRALIDDDVRGDVFNACADEHPTRRVLYTKAATYFGLEPPTFDDSDMQTGKTVSNKKLKERCDYEYIHPDPLVDL